MCTKQLPFTKMASNLSGDIEYKRATEDTKCEATHISQITHIHVLPTDILTENPSVRYDGNNHYNNISLYTV